MLIDVVDYLSVSAVVFVDPQIFVKILKLLASIVYSSTNNFRSPQTPAYPDGRRLNTTGSPVPNSVPDQSGIYLIRIWVFTKVAYGYGKSSMI